MNLRKGIDGRATSLMVLLCFIWAFQQIAMKAVAGDVSPILQVAVRSGISAGLVGLFMGWRGERISLGSGRWKPGIVVGVLFASEFLLFGEGLTLTTASHASVFLYTSPVFAALGLHWKVASERLKAAQWIGIGLAFAGIAVTFLGKGGQTASAPNPMLGDFLALLGGASWGLSTVVIRTTDLSDAPASETLLYQLLGAFALLSVFTVAVGQTGFRPTPIAVSSVIFQAVVVSFASYLAWFWLLRIYLASRLGVLSFMTPLFGVTLGVVLLHEPLAANFLVGAAFVIAGIVLVSGHEWLRQLFGATPKPLAEPEA